MAKGLLHIRFIKLFLGIFLLSCIGANQISANNSLQRKDDKSSTNINNSSEIYAKTYILGPGDTIYIRFYALPEISGSFTIGPDGFIYLPEIGKFYIEGFTDLEAKEELIPLYKKYVINPQFDLSVIKYRPIRVYVAGEVPRPGFYTLRIGPTVDDDSEEAAVSLGALTEITSSGSRVAFPTIFDALRSAKGITPYSDLSGISVIRKNSKSNGGGKIQTKLNFISLFTDGDQSQNIRIFDGDTIKVPKSNKIIKDQIIIAKNTNLSPEKITVYVSGQVPNPNEVKLPQGSTLNHALAVAGGKNLLSGKVEFIRFNDDGNADNRKFNYKSNAPVSSYQNPILRDGDIVNVKSSIVGTGTEVIQKVVSPIATSFTLYNLLINFSE
tara:strand:+ start:2966 stop:4114 length:1149 start_codon:yes stop_codon:yes gene_type:complete